MSIIDAAAIDKIAEYTNKVIESLTPIAQKAYETGLTVIRIDALQAIISLILLLFICIPLSIYLFKKIRTERDKSIFQQSDLVMCGGSIALVFSFVISVVSAIGLCNIWIWIKLFQPELWLAKTLLEKVLR